MENDTLRPILVKLASFCHQLSENQTDLARIVAREIPSVSPESQRVAQWMMEHNEKLRDVIADLGRELASSPLGSVVLGGLALVLCGIGNGLV